MTRLHRPILWLATGLHLGWGIMLVLDPGAGRISALFPFAAHGQSAAVLGLLLIGSGVLATAALLHRPTPWTFVALLPQQTLLALSAIAVVYFAWVGHFGDGVSRSNLFILADQWEKVLLALMHPFGLLRMHSNLIPKKTDG